MIFTSATLGYVIYVNIILNDFSGLQTTVFIFAHIISHGEYPSGKLSLRIEETRFLEYFQKSVLQEILGFLLIAAQLAEEIQQQPLAVTMIELIECRDITALDEFHQLLVASLPVSMLQKGHK